MKTMALKLEDEVSAQLTAIAQLEETSIAELLRGAIAELIASKRQGGALADKAQAALDEIDREAAERKTAITTLLGSAEGAKGRPRRTEA